MKFTERRYALAISRIMAVAFLVANTAFVYGQAPPAAGPAAAAPAPPAAGGGGGAFTSKTFDLKYVDPEQIRSVFSTQSYVIDANRDLKLLTARGPAAFLKEVEDTIKRLDVPPPVPPNAQITIYLLAEAAQAPTGVTLPAELKPLEKEVPGKLADMQMLRVRAGQSGETASAEPAAAPAVSLSHVRVESSAVNPGAKGDVVSINGLKVWLNIPPADAAATPAVNKSAKPNPDITADLDLNPNEPAVVAKIGVEKPVAVVIRVSLAK